jgi:hypothetical protein
MNTNDLIDGLRDFCLSINNVFGYFPYPGVIRLDGLEPWTLGCSAKCSMMVQSLLVLIKHVSVLHGIEMRQLAELQGTAIFSPALLYLKYNYSSVTIKHFSTLINFVLGL